jgi:hypothetical protein
VGKRGGTKRSRNEQNGSKRERTSRIHKLAPATVQGDSDEDLDSQPAEQGLPQKEDMNDVRACMLCCVMLKLLNMGADVRR